MCGSSPCMTIIAFDTIPYREDCTVHGKLPISGNKEADKHAEGTRNMPIDVGTLNQTSTIRTQISDQGTPLLQPIEHLFSHDSLPPCPFDGPANMNFSNVNFSLYILFFYHTFEN